MLIPSYNDLQLVVKRVKEIERRIGDVVGEYMVVDESDEESSLKYLPLLKKIDKVRILHRERRLGKWFAWSVALDFMLNSDFDALIELNADTFIEYPRRIVRSLEEGFDVVTCYSHYLAEGSPFASYVAKFYASIHSMWKRFHLFAMGGECLALSRRAVEKFKEHNLFSDPFPLDDYVISLAGLILGLKCTSIDCGLILKLPQTLNEWMMYRLRHREKTLEMAHLYLKRKLGSNYFRKADWLIDRYWQMYKFIVARHLISSFFGTAPLVILQYLLAKIPFQVESPITWRRLQSEKRLSSNDLWSVRTALLLFRKPKGARL